MKIFDLSDERKKKKVQKTRTHTIDCASIFGRELSDDELELVIGGMKPQDFGDWRAVVLNERG